MSALLLGAPVGLAAGSVAGAALMRWPAGETLGRPARSRCDRCGATVPVRDVLPVIGWILQRGRCGACAGRIDLAQPVLEVAAAAVVVVGMAAAPGVAGMLLASTGVVLILAAALDVRHRLIPDRLTLPAAALIVPAALAVAVRAGGEATVLLHGLGVPCLLAGLGAASRRSPMGPWFGGGDVKLLPTCLASAALVPGGPGILWSAALGSAGMVASVGLLVGRLGRRDSLPFGPFLLVGYVCVLVRSALGVG